MRPKCALQCALMVDHPTILRNAPLQIVALELRFPETPFEPSDLKAIRRALADTYPDAATEHGIGIELSPEGVRQQQTNQRQVYRTIDGSHQIGLTQTTLALEARGPKYNEFAPLERWISCAGRGCAGCGHPHAAAGRTALHQPASSSGCDERARGTCGPHHPGSAGPDHR